MNTKHIEGATSARQSTPLTVFYKHALASIAYRHHLDEYGVDPRTIVDIDTFATLPPFTKDQLRRHSVDEILTTPPKFIGTWSTSAGTSGTPTYWPRGTEAAAHSAALFGSALRSLADTEHRSALIVITFPLGMYVGGTLSYSAILELQRRGHMVAATTPGMDIEAIREIMKVAGPHYDQCIVFGYPPVVRELFDGAETDVTALDIKILVGGEPVSEAWRTKILEMIGRPGDAERIMVVYGSTDTNFIGHETPATIAIRRAAAESPDLNGALFGARYGHDGPVMQPAFVRYEPELTYIETDADEYLLFTVDASVPIIRYRVNDRGDVLTGAQLRGRLLDAGRADLAARVVADDAYLLVHGRTDVAAIFNAANIFPDMVRPAVEHLSLARQLTGNFVLRVAVDDEQQQTLELDVELGIGVAPDVPLAEHVAQLAVASMRQLSAEYRVVHNSRGQAAEPRVRLVAHGDPQFQTTGKQRTVQ